MLDVKYVILYVMHPLANIIHQTVKIDLIDSENPGNQPSCLLFVLETYSFFRFLRSALVFEKPYYQNVCIDCGIILSVW